jgi:lysophospholipid acyltransferase (LPLAT)-like uncharacterized protein
VATPPPAESPLLSASRSLPRTGRPLRLDERIALGLLVPIGRGAVRLLGATLRLTEVTAPAVERLWASRSPIIYAIWHGRILVAPYLYEGRRRAYILASRSRDGELVSRFAGGFGFDAVRGSTSRGASTALRALARLLREESAEVVLIPDGPRGPRYVAQAGPVLLAKLGRAPIVPVGLGASPATALASWDEFVVPHPFARVTVIFGEPLTVSPDADRVGLEAARLRLEEAMRRLTGEADHLAGARRVPAL